MLKTKFNKALNIIEKHLEDVDFRMQLYSDEMRKADGMEEQTKFHILAGECYEIKKELEKIYSELSKLK